MELGEDRPVTEQEIRDMIAMLNDNFVNVVHVYVEGQPADGIREVVVGGGPKEG